MKRHIGITADWLNQALKHRLPVNYFLWYPFLVYQGWLEYLSLDGIGGIAADYRLWIWIAALLNSVILTVGLIWVDSLVEASRQRWLRWFWGGCVGVIAAAFFADFCLYKMMAIHLPTGLRLLLGNGWRQFLLTVEASGVRPAHLRQFLWWGIAAFAGGILITRATWWLSRRGPILVSVKPLVAGALALATALTLWELETEHDNPWAKSWEEVHRVMAFDIDLLHHVNGRLLPVGPLRPLHRPQNFNRGVAQVQSPGRNTPKQPLKEAGVPAQEHSASGDLTTSGLNLGQAIPAPHLESPSARPDAFVFVLESTRGDYVTKEIAPNLARFSDDCLKLRDSLASGNATQLSWFSLLTANQPLYFAMVRHRPELWGSAALRLLRGAGYEIHVLSSTYLNYNDIDRIAFGPGLELADSVVDAGDLQGRERPDRDREITRRLVRAIPRKHGGRVFLVFYDSTHHDYYWPSDSPAPFQPFAQEWKYFDFSISPADLSRIKNRYRNARHFIDALFGTVVDELKAKARYEGALVFAVGDHGEEFLEHGKLVHASELWREQIHVPFLLKLPAGVHPAGYENAARLIGSHVDFLPTLLGCLGIAFPTNLFDGQSLFQKRSDFALTAADNGGRDPCRFCLCGSGLKAWFQYRPGPTFTALERSIYLTKFTDSLDHQLPVEVNSPQGLQLLEHTFGDALAHLYPAWPIHKEPPF